VRIRFAGIVAILAMLVAACGGSGKSPKPTPSAPASSPPTTALSTAPTGPLTTGPGVQPGEKPPVLSDAARQHTSAGALLFADYYVRALDWSVATNDTYLLEQISAPSCTACQRNINAAAALRRQGAIEKGGRITRISSRLVTGTFKVKSDFVIETIAKDDPIVILRPSSSASTAAPAVARDSSLVFVSWISTRWQVVEEGAPS
jgi:hypothetical protein